MMMKYGIFAAVILSAVGYVTLLRSENAALRSKAVIASVQIRACDARNENISEDGVSDAEIDNLDDLRDAAAQWLRN